MGGLPNQNFANYPAHALKKSKKNERSELNAYFKKYYYKKIILI